MGGMADAASGVSHNDFMDRSSHRARREDDGLDRHPCWKATAGGSLDNPAWQNGEYARRPNREVRACSATSGFLAARSRRSIAERFQKTRGCAALVRAGEALMKEFDAND